MATMVASPVFVDTNILIYARLASSPFHTLAVESLDRFAAAGVELWTSRQILREYLASITRPTTAIAPLAVAALVADIRGFESRFRVAEDGPSVTAELLQLLSRFISQGKQIHDANIVATMLAHGIPYLLTHNTADFTRFATAITVLPLVAPTPPALPVPPTVPGSAPPLPPPGVP